jgi:hypothetical protein
MLRYMAMMISTIMANLQSIKNDQRLQEAILSWLCDLVHETICDGKTSLVEGEQRMK